MSNIDETAKALILNTIQSVFTESTIDEPIVEETAAEKLRREVAEKIAHDLQERKEATKMYKSGDATTSDEKETTIKEKSVKNTITINPTLEEEIAQLTTEQMIVTNADKKGNTPAYQNYKKGMKNPKTGEPVYKAADHMKEDLLASGVFSEHEITKILWSEFDESREYAQNPEKYHDSQGYDKKLEKDKPFHKRSRAARMADPERGINSPAFKKFMADRGMSV